MISMTVRSIGFLSLLLVATLAIAEVPVYAPVAAELIRPRDGLGNVLQKLEEGKQVKIDYLGGSIMAENGWRVK